MVSRRFVLAAIVLAVFGSACTAIVLGKIGDTSDYEDKGASSSSGGSSAVDECSLLATGSGSERDANACSECITTSCKEHVEYACNRGDKSEGKKPWFTDLSDCAKNPWLDYSLPGAGASFYECKSFDLDAGVISGDTEAAKKRAAELCVRDNCLTGELPSCKLCEVSTQATGTNERALLRDDPCGKCLSANCLPDIVRCCNADVMNKYVEPCAFTADEEKKAACKLLAAADAGLNPRASEGELSCFTSLSSCFKKNCAALPECK